LRLLKHNQNPYDEFRQTPLHVAATENRLDLIRAFLKQYDWINVQDSNGWTPLHCAAAGANLDTIFALLEHKDADASILTKENTSALHYAVRHVFGDDQADSFREVLALLVERGADVNTKNRHGETALHSACLKGNEVAARFLLIQKAQVDAKTDLGETGLHYAVRAGRFGVVVILTEFNADPLIQSDEKLTPLEVAEQYNQTNILKFLMDYTDNVFKPTHPVSPKSGINIDGKSLRSKSTMKLQLKGIQRESSATSPTRNLPQIVSLPSLSLTKGESGVVAAVPEEQADKSGYLKLCINHKREKWERYWFVLKNHSLYQYQSPEELKPSACLSTLGVKVEDADDLYPNSKYCFMLTVSNVAYVFSAESLSDKLEWFFVLNPVVSTSYTPVSARGSSQTVSPSSSYSRDDTLKSSRHGGTSARHARASHMGTSHMSSRMLPSKSAASVVTSIHKEHGHALHNGPELERDHHPAIHSKQHARKSSLVHSLIATSKSTSRSPHNSSRKHKEKDKDKDEMVISENPSYRKSDSVAFKKIDLPTVQSGESPTYSLDKGAPSDEAHQDSPASVAHTKSEEPEEADSGGGGKPMDKSTQSLQNLLDACGDDFETNLSLLLLDDSFDAVATICEQDLMEDDDQLMKAVLAFFDNHNRIIPLLKWALSQEIKSTSNQGTLFREISIATRLLSVYFFDKVGIEYLHSVLSPLVSDIYSQRETFEVDPNKAPKGTDVNANLEKVLACAQSFLHRLFDSVDQFPVSFRQALHHVQTEVEKRFPQMSNTAVGSFLFLRFFGPVIVSPDRYNLADHPPSPENRRGLVLITKLLQGLANGVEFDGSKEEYMRSFNKFITTNQRPMTSFFEVLIDEENINARLVVSFAVQGKDSRDSLSYIHKFLVRRMERLTQPISHVQKFKAKEGMRAKLSAWRKSSIDSLQLKTRGLTGSLADRDRTHERPPNPFALQVSRSEGKEKLEHFLATHAANVAAAADLSELRGTDNLRKSLAVTSPSSLHTHLAQARLSKEAPDSLPSSPLAHKARTAAAPAALEQATPAAPATTLVVPEAATTPPPAAPEQAAPVSTSTPIVDMGEKTEAVMKKQTKNEQFNIEEEEED